MMWLSQLAYEVRHASHKLGPVLERWSLRLVTPLARDVIGGRTASTRGFVAAGRGAAFVAFAGTDPVALANWITNLNLGVRPRDLHSGFEAAVDAAWPALSAALTDLEPLPPLFVTGHSLGGALAYVAAARLWRDKQIAPSAVYTFGAPRAGSAGFARDYIKSGLGERTFRIVHGLDIVPSLPPSALGFRHAGHALICNRGERCAEGPLLPCDCDDPPFFDTLRRGYRQRLHDIATGTFLPSPRADWLGPYQKYALAPPLTDHLPERYRRALEA